MSNSSVSTSSLPPERSPYYDFTKALTWGAGTLALITSLAIGGILLANMHALTEKFFTQTSSIVLGSIDALFLLTLAIAGYNYYKLHKAEEQRQKLVSMQPKVVSGQEEDDTILELPQNKPEPEIPDDVPKVTVVIPPPVRNEQPPKAPASTTRQPGDVTIGSLGTALQAQATPSEDEKLLLALFNPKNVKDPTFQQKILEEHEKMLNASNSAPAKASEKPLTKAEVQQLAKDLLKSMQGMFEALVTSEGAVNKCDVVPNIASVKQAFARLNALTDEIFQDPAYVVVIALLRQYEHQDALVKKWLGDHSGWTSLDAKGMLQAIARDIEKFFPQAEEALKPAFEGLRKLSAEKLSEIATRAGITFALNAIATRSRTVTPWDNRLEFLEETIGMKVAGYVPGFVPQYLVEPKPSSPNYKAHKKLYDAQWPTIQRLHIERILLTLIKEGVASDQLAKMSEAVIEKTLPLLTDIIFKPLMSMPVTMQKKLAIISESFAQMKADKITTVRQMLENTLYPAVITLIDSFSEHARKAPMYSLTVNLPGYLGEKIAVVREIGKQMLDGIFPTLWRASAGKSPLDFQKKLFELLSDPDNDLTQRIGMMSGQIDDTNPLKVRVENLTKKFCVLIESTMRNLARGSESSIEKPREEVVLPGHQQSRDLQHEFAEATAAAALATHELNKRRSK